jgi:hypothetical protein
MEHIREPRIFRHSRDHDWVDRHRDLSSSQGREARLRISARGRSPIPHSSRNDEPPARDVCRASRSAIPSLGQGPRLRELTREIVRSPLRGGLRFALFFDDVASMRYTFLQEDTTCRSGLELLAIVMLRPNPESDASANWRRSVVAGPVEPAEIHVDPDELDDNPLDHSRTTNLPRVFPTRAREER